MRKKILLFVVILVFTSSYCNAGVDEKMVGEIIVNGLTRSAAALVMEYLPVKVGDRWYNDSKELIKRALYEAEIFDPFSLNVSTNEMKSGQIRVIINLKDPNVFMYHPLLYGISRVGDLLSSQMNQRIINPTGNGLSFSMGVNWKTDDFENDNPGPWKGFGMEQVGSNGKVYAYDYRYFEEHSVFNQRNYDLTGRNHVISLKQIISSKIILEYFIAYQNADYRENNNLQEQEFIISSIGAELYKDFCIKLGHGFDLSGNNSDFNLCNFDFVKIYNIRDTDEFVLCFKGGLASSNRPLNFQFKGGGYSDIPLRGREFDLAGNVYLINNMEYHKQLFLWGLQGIVFLDSGKMAGNSKEFSKGDYMLDAGIGIAFKTPLGLIRLDRGFNLSEDGDTWNFSFGHTF